MKFLMIFVLPLTLLTGCLGNETTTVRTEYVVQKIPESMLYCADIPKAGLLAQSETDAVRRYIVDLHSGFTDCKSKVDGIRKIQETTIKNTGNT